MRVIAEGARLVMREYSRIKAVSDGDATELRQLSIVPFNKLALTKAPKATTRLGTSNAPADNVWRTTDTQGKLRWGAPRLNMAPPLALPPLARSETRVARVNATIKQNPWKPGLNWFSPRAK